MEWISVKDETPIKGERVLTLNEYKYQSICWLNNGWNTGEHKKVTNEITHWMP